MRCPACGQLLLEGTKYCPSCGAKMEAQPVNDWQDTGALGGQDGYTERSGASEDSVWDGRTVDNTSRYGYDGQTSEDNRAYTVYDQVYTHQPELPMKWYKFLIYVSLVLSTIMNVYSGVTSITGMQYGTAETARRLYTLYGALKPIDIIFGVLSIVLGLYALIVRQKLAHFKKDGPKHLIIMYTMSIVMSALYIIAAFAATGILALDIATAFALGLQICIVIANKVYFDKRAHLFKE